MKDFAIRMRESLLNALSDESLNESFQESELLQKELKEFRDSSGQSYRLTNLTRVEQEHGGTPQRLDEHQIGVVDGSGKVYALGSGEHNSGKFVFVLRTVPTRDNPSYVEECEALGVEPMAPVLVAFDPQLMQMSLDARDAVIKKQESERVAAALNTSYTDGYVKGHVAGMREEKKGEFEQGTTNGKLEILNRLNFYIHTTPWYKRVWHALRGGMNMYFAIANKDNK